MSKQTTEHPAQLTWHSHLDPWEFLLFGEGRDGAHGLAVRHLSSVSWKVRLTTLTAIMFFTNTGA